MDRFDVIQFADLSGPDGGEWIRIGGGSFGVVFKGEYLGTQVAIKEVLPNTTYDVEKYFERECVLMKEARHPNIVQYIGLSKSPGPDGRIYIISEFVGGNLRSYIADERKPFPWRLRISFATDIARALAYLHARNCMHRDLKGENLLITANDRIKVCDFGFARIAARNEEEMRRISYCGTDGYMSPEILMGIDFSLPSDIFSLGVIFCEIASRHLVDSNTFKRSMPGFGLDADEVREMASPGCPQRFIQLALDCVEEEAQNRPDMREVIRRLREIEIEVVQHDEAELSASPYNVGSVRGSTINAVLGSKAKRPSGPPRIPSFAGSVKVGRSGAHAEHQDADGSSGDEMDEALAALAKVGIDAEDGKIVDPASPVKAAISTIKGGSTYKVSGHGNPWWSDDMNQTLPSLNGSWISPGRAARADPSTATNGTCSRPLLASDRADADYSTSVVRSSKTRPSHAPLDATASALTAGHAAAWDGPEDVSESVVTVRTVRQNGHGAQVSEADTLRGAGSVYMDAGQGQEHDDVQAGGTNSVPQSFMTARTHRADPSLAVATIASSSSTIRESPALYHRFTLVKNSTKRPPSLSAAASAAASGSGGPSTGSLLPPAIMLSNALAKCWVCNKRIGWKPFLDCDDCPYKTHVACGELAPANCQDLQLPPAPMGFAPAPVLSSANASRRNSKANDGIEVGAAAAALKAMNVNSEAGAGAGSSAAAGTGATENKEKDKGAKSKKKEKEKEKEKEKARKSASPASSARTSKVGA